MTAPETAAARFFWCLVLGAALGAVYDFLRPLGSRHSAVRDLLFFPAAFYGWLTMTFRICQGDLRLPALVGLGLGALGWILVPGRLLRPVIAVFWKIVRKTGALFAAPGKIFLKNMKILFASGRKYVTIEWNNRRQKRRKSGGNAHGKTATNYQPHSAGVPPQSDRHQNRGDSDAGAVHRRFGDPAFDHERASG